MRFSIIIPAHNAENRLHGLLSIITSQRYPREEYETIVICDSCKDKSEKVARKYGAITKSVEHHRDGLTRNEGIEMAHGDYLLFIDDDDWWLHDMTLAIVDNMLKANADPDVLACAFIWKDVGYVGAQMQNGAFWPNVWSKVWKRSFVGDSRFSDEWSVSDLAFTKAVFEKHPHIAVSSFPLVYYNYMRPGSITETDSRGGGRRV